MRLSAVEKTLAPDLHHYLRDSMPQCANISVIVNNLVKCGGLSVTEARSALLWDTDPLVVTSIPANLRCSRFGHAKCAFDAGNPNVIEINLADYNEFANGRGIGLTSAGRAVPIVGVGLLHALCHWGNRRNGVKETSEQGFEFERLTYGRTIG